MFLRFEESSFPSEKRLKAIQANLGERYSKFPLNCNRIEVPKGFWQKVNFSGTSLLSIFTQCLEIAKERGELPSRLTKMTFFSEKFCKFVTEKNIILGKNRE